MKSSKQLKLATWHTVTTLMLTLSACSIESSAPLVISRGKEGGLEGTKNKAALVTENIKPSPDGSASAILTNEQIKNQCERPVKDFLHSTLNAGVFKSNCSLCHKPDGAAKNSGLVFIGIDADKLYESVTLRLSSVSAEDSLLLKKPTLKLPHAGGLVLEDGSVGLADLSKLSAMHVAARACIDKATVEKNGLATTTAPLPISVPPSTAVSPAMHISPDLGARDIQLLENEQFKASVERLVHVTLDVSALPKPGKSNHLSNESSRLLVQNSLHMQELLRLATMAASKAPIAQLFNCTVDIDNCVKNLLPDFLGKAFRRGALPEERDHFFQVYMTAKASKSSHQFGLRAVLQEVLISPHFIYRTESADSSARPASLTEQELANRLSYALKGTPPDVNLQNAVANHSLLTDAGIEAQVSRLLLDPQTANRFSKFVFEWLGIDRLNLSSKSAALLTGLPETLQASMVKEADMLVKRILIEQQRPLQDLFLSNVTYIDESLANHYGISGVSGPEFRAVSLASTARLGILTTGAVLAANAKESGRSPMSRGSYVIDHLLCQRFPTAFGNPAMELPHDSTGTKSLRERFGEVQAIPSCKGCHDMLTIGFAFERFDVLGKQVDLSVISSKETAADFKRAGMASLDVADAADFSRKIVRHSELHRCYVSQVYRFLTGRDVGKSDVPFVDTLLDGFLANKQSTGWLIGKIVVSDKFKKTVPFEETIP